MDESSKSRGQWGELELSILQGEGIDIGCGKDPVGPGVRGFDMADGDANEITRFVPERFDFVYSSHCLEHMRDPREALRQWWELVRPGGHLFFIVPDEDLYEQGVFPSRFNPDHKATFTIAKQASWSPVSHNVLDLAGELPCARIRSLKLQDQGYDRRLLKHGARRTSLPGLLVWALRGCARRVGLKSGPLEWLGDRCLVVDQTLRPDALAQIACIVQKVEAPDNTG